MVRGRTYYYILWPPKFAIVAVWLIVILAAANAASTLVECGLTWCADNPVRYELLIRGP